MPEAERCRWNDLSLLLEGDARKRYEKLACAERTAFERRYWNLSRPLWLRVGIALAFVAPAAIAGYHATHGIVKHTMPSEGWQIAFSVVGAIAVGIAAFLRIAAMAAPEPAGREIARG